MHLRRKIIAHSDEEEMHYRTSTFPVFEGEINIPHFQFNEGLHLEENELFKLETLLRRLKDEIASFFYKVSQNNPDTLHQYHEPKSWDAFKKNDV